MLQISNSTPFPAEVIPLPDTDGVDTLFAVVKGTFAIGGTVEIAEEQLPVALADEYHGEPDKSSIRIPSDVALGKPATDVLLLGTAWAPNGRAVWQTDVTLSVGPVSKTARVSGDRIWTAGRAGATMSWVTPFVQIPLVWERAFGGSDETSKGRSSYRANPVGVGYRAPGSTKNVDGMPVPNIEDPAALISAPSDAPAPVGFAAVAPHWQPRVTYAGTYDQQWQDRRAPFLPDDFDRRFFQVAPQGLVSPGYLEPGTWVQARGVTPSGSLQFQLPRIRIETTYLLDDLACDVASNLDTVIIEPDASRIVVIWRSAFRCDKRLRRVNEIRVGAKGDV